MPCNLSWIESVKLISLVFSPGRLVHIYVTGRRRGRRPERPCRRRQRCTPRRPRSDRRLSLAAAKDSRQSVTYARPAGVEHRALVLVNSFGLALAERINLVQPHLARTRTASDISIRPGHRNLGAPQVFRTSLLHEPTARMGAVGLNLTQEIESAGGSTSSGSGEGLLMLLPNDMASKARGQSSGGLIKSEGKTRKSGDPREVSFERCDPAGRRVGGGGSKRRAAKRGVASGLT